MVSLSNQGIGEGICSSILRLKEDASLREAMGSNGRRYLERHMSLEKNVALYEEIFCTLPGVRGSPGGRFPRGARKIYLQVME